MLRVMDWSMSKKIGVVVLVFALLTCGVIGIGIYGIRSNDATAQDVLETQARALFLASAGQERAAHMHQLAFEMIADTDPARWAELQKNVIATADDLGKTLTDMRSVLDDGDMSLYNGFKPMVDDYRAAELRAFQLQSAGQHPEAEAQMHTVASPVFERLSKQFDTLVTQQVRDMDEARAAIHATSQMTLIGMVATGLTGLALALSAALLMVRMQISRPLGAMTRAMRQLAGGDTSLAVPGVGRKDEIGAMAAAVQFFKDAAITSARVEAEAAQARTNVEAERAASEKARLAAAAEQAAVVDRLAAGLQHLSDCNLAFRLNEPFAQGYDALRANFNAAMVKLADTLASVTSATAAIHAGSSEISTAADDLSRRTEQQASSLEETAAALDQITATVRKTSEGVDHARAVVSSAKADAERSRAVVGQAVQAMTAIAASSDQITQIIGVIDEIAFQTNLLALNAGVEAARAGDAGRGFAVVASEVRALAQRSAEAAKEIKALISTSRTQVGAGVNLVGETGASLKRIAEQVAEINGIMGEIACSAAEQATGLDQVNAAVNQMDQVTQQNAAMVEQSTAASHGLTDEARTLAQLVGQFRTGTSGRPVREAASSTATALKTTGRGGAARMPNPQPESDWAQF